jgi:hypothetical protein
MCPKIKEERMSAGKERVEGRRRVLIVAATVVPLLAMAGFVRECVGSQPGNGLLLAGHAAGWSHPRLIYLPPGMLISDKPPEGWSHLVLKSIPRLTSGDKGTLPKGSSATANRFRTVILANVRPLDVAETDFELDQIGVGICVPKDEDQDIVVAADRLDALGLKLSTVQRVVLDQAEAELKESRIISRTSTFALLRGPATVVSGEDHRKVTLNYGFCVERNTGKLQIGLWTMFPESKALKAPSALVRLGANPVFDCQLDVRARRILGTVPYSWSFAMSKLPDGKTLRVPPSLGELITVISRHPDEGDPEELERLLMKTLATLPDPDRGLRRTAIPPPVRSR